ncbi:MAG: hypothetical protein KBT06_04880 [Prevotellaceae bacterium]|nr:hypothetical protein [Candidatus Colivivens equi]MCQ2076484.1 hypothetical protein [Bacteroidaceae bacterium]
MNVFVRYFDNEILATSLDEVIHFLESIDEVEFSESDIKRIDNYMQSINLYPFRLKVSFSNYVLLLKSEANTLEEFKEIEQQRKLQKAMGISPAAEKKKTIMDFFNEEHIGWYISSITFKRVVQVAGTTKFQYKDTYFKAKLKANSGMHCYTRMTDYLRSRQDIDPRSQFPSIKSNNFVFEFIGDNLDEPTNNPREVNVTEMDDIPELQLNEPEI